MNLYCGSDLGKYNYVSISTENDLNLNKIVSKLFIENFVEIG